MELGLIGMQNNCKYVLCSTYYFSRSIEDRIVLFCIPKKVVLKITNINLLRKGKQRGFFDMKNKSNGM